jgi:hypothetical protein
MDSDGTFLTDKDLSSVLFFPTISLHEKKWHVFKTKVIFYGDLILAKLCSWVSLVKSHIYHSFPQAFDASIFQI